MPRSEFHRELMLASSPEETWRALTDVRALVGWISIVEMGLEIEPLARYSGVLMDRLGPFKLRADLDIEVTDVVEGRSLRVTAEGEDRQVRSRLAIGVSMSLSERSPAGTIVVFRGTYEVTGKVASMGSGTINKKAEKVLDEFFSCVLDELGAA